MIFLSKIRSSNLACFVMCYCLRMSYVCLQLTTATSGIFSIIFVIRGTRGVEQLRNTSIHLKFEIESAILIDAFYYKFAKSEQALQRNWLTFDFCRGDAKFCPSKVYIVSHKKGQIQPFEWTYQVSQARRLQWNPSPLQITTNLVLL